MIIIKLQSFLYNRIGVCSLVYTVHNRGLKYGSNFNLQNHHILSFYFISTFDKSATLHESKLFYFVFHSVEYIIFLPPTLETPVVNLQVFL